MATVATPRSDVNARARLPANDANTTPQAAMNPEARASAHKVTRSASRRSPRPRARPTITLAASPTAIPGKNDVRMVESAIWCAAISRSPMELSSVVRVAKASISKPNWIPVGAPRSRISSIARPKPMAERVRVRADRRASRTNSASIAASSTHSVEAVPKPPPRTPRAGSPKCP